MQICWSQHWQHNGFAQVLLCKWITELVLRRRKPSGAWHLGAGGCTTRNTFHETYFGPCISAWLKTLSSLSFLGFLFIAASLYIHLLRTVAANRPTNSLSSYWLMVQPIRMPVSSMVAMARMEGTGSQFAGIPNHLQSKCLLLQLWDQSTNWSFQSMLQDHWIAFSIAIEGLLGRTGKWYETRRMLCTSFYISQSTPGLHQQFISSALLR